MKNEIKQTNKPSVWLFVLPSLLGIFLFLVPVPINGTTTVMFGHINTAVKSGSGINGVSTLELIQWFGAIAAAVSAVITIAYKIKPELEFWKNKFGKIFVTSSMGALVRVLGAIIFMQVMLGPISGVAPMPAGHIFEWFTHDYTGVIIVGFVGSLIVTFTIGTLILPLLLEFGLLEFIGAKASKVTQTLFKVPGRAAIDAAASFVGDGTLGIVVTDEQYAKGHYTKREAVTIATGFSVVGIAFTTLVAGELGFLSGFDFFMFYGTIIFTTLVLAVIIPRTPIMKLYPNKTINGEEKVATQDNTDYSALDSAAAKAHHGMDNLKSIYQKSLLSVVAIIMTWIPIIIVVGSMSLAIAEGMVYGIDLFGIIAAPLTPLVKLLQIPDAKLVAEGIMVSITDMYIPTIIIGESTSELAKFVVGTMSFITIIFFAETGVVLMKSKMKLSFFEIVMFFMVRVILALPIVALIGHILF